MPNPRECPECEHMPSERVLHFNGDVEGDCPCKCHDIADAAPKLLAACKVLLPGLARMGSDWGDEMHALVSAAVAKAEGRPDATAH